MAQNSWMKVVLREAGRQGRVKERECVREKDLSACEMSAV
jgi:hypothetical protein